MALATAIAARPEPRESPLVPTDAPTAGQPGELARLVVEMEAATAAIVRQEPEDLRRLRTGQLDNQAGSYGQYFSTLDIAAGMLRDYAGYTLYPLVRMARDPAIDDATLVRLVHEFDPQYTNYLGYSGLTTLAGFAARLRQGAAGAPRAELALALAALNRHANRTNAWCHHFFPWSIGGERYRYHGEPAAPPPAPAALPPPLSAQDTVIELAWEPLGIRVRAALAVDRNPALCQDLLDALPFTTLQEHAVVTGKSMFAWTPVVSTAPVPVKEQINLAPVGRLRFSQNTGQKLIVQYGPTSEDLLAPVLGQVVAEDVHLLEAVGAAAWSSNFEQPREIWLTVTRG